MLLGISGLALEVVIVNADNVAKLGMNTGNSSEAIARIDSGAGIDTFKLAGASILLDLSLLSGPALQNVEKIDLTGSGNNSLKLNLTDMLQSFDDSNVFNWTAAGTNVVAISGGTSQTYVAYNHNTSAQQLLIDQAILVLAVL